MNVKGNPFNYKHIFASWVVVIISLLKLTNQRIIVTPSPWNYECDEGAGIFPHAFDCQRFWLCRKSFNNINTIEDGNGKSSDLRIDPHLFKCPNGYHFDIKIKFCQPQAIATCSVHIATTTTTTAKPEARDIGLLGLLFGLP